MAGFGNGGWVCSGFFGLGSGGFCGRARTAEPFLQPQQDQLHGVVAVDDHRQAQLLEVDGRAERRGRRAA